MVPPNGSNLNTNENLLMNTGNDFGHNNTLRRDGIDLDNSKSEVFQRELNIILENLREYPDIFGDVREIFQIKNSFSILKQIEIERKQREFSIKELQKTIITLNSQIRAS